MRVLLCNLVVILTCFGDASAFSTLPLPSQNGLLRSSFSRSCRCSSTLVQSTAASSVEDVQSEIDSKLSLLKTAAETKQEESDKVIQALLDLEKLSRQAAKLDENYAQEMLKNLDGSWRLIFTTGTAKTQEKYGKINYFPLKAVQSFDVTDWKIENGIYLGDFCALQFSGDFSFDLKKRKVEFDFNNVCLLQLFDIKLGKGEAANLGAKSGLGSESNVANAAKDKSAFFNWISADESIATARGGGGGLALWKRVVE